MTELALRSDAASPQHQHWYDTFREISAIAYQWFLSGIRRPATEVVETIRGKINGKSLAGAIYAVFYRILLRWPIALAMIIVDRMLDMSQSSDTHGTHVSTFHSASGEVVAIPISFIACLFGAIHCAGWFFIFPTIIETTIWRVCSGIITGAPLIPMVVGSIAIIDADISLSGFVETILAWLVGLTALLYVAARFGLLVEALITLRDLPPSAYDIVTWTTFLPHI